MKFGFEIVIGILLSVLLILFLKEVLKKRRNSLYSLDENSYEKAVKNKLDEIDSKKKKR